MKNKLSSHLYQNNNQKYKKGKVIFCSNTIINPGTVMIIDHYTAFTKFAVSRSFWLFNLSFTKFYFYQYELIYNFYLLNNQGKNPRDPSSYIKFHVHLKAL